MISRALASLLLFASVPALAQGLYQPVGMSDADALAAAVRRVGSNPLDLEALLTAGELSVRVEDLSAAGSFFARAGKIDPRSGRVKAGEGAILVRSQRPAQALLLFDQAERLGFAPARFASDRGLAFDLLGDPGRAQRDYKLALGTRPDAETRRRYALSLGIAGRQAQALGELAPLIRDNDRAAWRTRAFVLAMSGDAAEASRIAQTMMPPGAAAGLRSFFAELPRLSPADRAFAVHFGETRPTAVRLADARLAPRQAPLALEPVPVRLAVVQAAPATARKNKRDRRKRNAVQLAVMPAPPPMPVPMQPPAYQAPAYTQQIAAAPTTRDRPLSAGELASLARAGVRNLPRSTPATTVPGARALTPAEQASLAAATLRPRGSVASARREPVAVASVAPVVPQIAARPPIAATPSTLSLAQTAVRRDSVAVAGIAASVSQAAVRPSVAPTLSLAQTDVRPQSPVTSVPPVASVPSPSVVAATAPSVTPGAAVPTAITAPPAATATPVAVAPTSAVASLVAPTPLALTPATGTGLAPQPAAPTPLPTPVSVAAALPAASSLPPVSPAPSPVAASTVSSALTPVVTSAPVAVAGVATAALDTPAPGFSEPPTSPSVPAETVVSAEAADVAAPVVAAAAVTSTPLAPLVTPPVAPAVAAPVRRPRIAREGADTILAKIVANLTIPAAELDVGSAAAAPTRMTTRRTAEVKPAVDKRADKAAADKKAAAEKKALVEKKAAADKKALADKEAAAEKKLAASQPKRIWVQVAGGANEGDLAKAWRTARNKAPAVLGSRQGWTTPLRATNRVLTGPFKTDAEARAHVNQLAKAGVSAFTFTSELGQKITRLDTK